MRFRDRRHAGLSLAGLLERYQDRPDVLVLALPRGGVPVAYEVATALGVPWDLFLVRKLGVPGQEELAMGAIAEGDVVVLNDLAQQVPEEVVRRVIRSETRELRRRGLAYRGGRVRLEIAGRTLIVVDDGLATGASMRAAVEALRDFGPHRIVVAVPTAPENVCAEFDRITDEVVCARIVPSGSFGAVGRGFRDFSQVSDEDVRSFLGLTQDY
jgi:putative phosphoribosyl transferase